MVNFRFASRTHWDSYFSYATSDYGAPTRQVVQLVLMYTVQTEVRWVGFMLFAYAWALF